MSVRKAISSAVERRALSYGGKLRRALSKPADTRAVRLYEQIRSDNTSAKPIYQAGEFWDAINEEFRTLIWAGGLSNLRNQYFNRRFSGPEPCSWQVYSALLSLYHDKLCALDTEAAGFVNSLSDPEVGGTGDQIIFDGRAVSLDLLQSAEEVLTLRDAWKRTGKSGAPEILVELGAGYGRLCYVARKMWPDCTYVILDLPEALICAHSWLERVMPGDIIAYDQARDVASLDRNTLRGHPVWLLGAQHIERLAKQSADVFINVYSFAEMPRASIDNYFLQLARVTSGIFYTKQRRLERNSEDHCTIAEDEYPVPVGAETLIDRSPSLYPAFFERVYDLSRLVQSAPEE